MSKKGEIKACNYRLICWPDSSNIEVVIQALKEMGLVAFGVSPLHDKDKYDSDRFDESGNIVAHAGDFKKPHYHIFLKFAGGTLWSTVKNRIAQPLCLDLSPLASKCRK